MDLQGLWHALNQPAVYHYPHTSGENVAMVGLMVFLLILAVPIFTPEIMDWREKRKDKKQKKNHQKEVTE